MIEMLIKGLNMSISQIRLPGIRVVDGLRGWLAFPCYVACFGPREQGRSGCDVMAGPDWCWLLKDCAGG